MRALSRSICILWIALEALAAVAAWGQGVAEVRSRAASARLGSAIATADPETGEAPELATQYLRVAGSNFVPRDSTTTFFYGNNGCLQRTSNTGDSWFTYDVQLPQGAVLQRLRLYYFDLDNTNNVSSQLWTFDGAGGSSLLAEAFYSGAPGYGNATSPMISHSVNNASESLVVVASLPGGTGTLLRLCGVRLQYQTPEPIFEDGFESGGTEAWDGVVPFE